MTLLRFRSAVGAALVMFAAQACGDDTSGPDGDNGGTSTPVQTTSVDVIDNSFDPDDIQVGVGQTVTWTWRGVNSHSVTFDDPAVGSSTVKAEGGFQRTFDGTGRFTYFCTVHGRAIMSGEVIVE